MQFKTFLKASVKIKHLELIGEASHSKLSPPYRLKLAERMKEKAKTAKVAAVLALFYPNSVGETYLALILRKTYKGVHSAQVGFPGGKQELSDKNLQDTALRETEEEIGITSSDITVNSKLSPLYIPPSNFIVHPYFAVTETTPNFIKQDAEVEDIIEVSLDDFLDNTNIISTLVPTSYNVEVEVPAFSLNGHVVWGATAMMLSEIKDLLNQAL